MQKISFLLLGTSLSFIPQTIFAAECAVTDCSLLGYTDSACPGSGLKCPFGDGWYCGGGAAEDCIKLGYDKSCTGAGESGSGETCNGKYQSCNCDSSYKYTCSGTGYSGGSGTACGGKYTTCNCASGYEWNGSSCSETIPAVTCTIGTLYYSNGKCYNQKIASQTLLGVVIYEKTPNQSGWIMTVNPITTGVAWGEYGVVVPGLSMILGSPTDIQDSCTNTDIITAYGSPDKYQAAWAAKEYHPQGTPNGQSWCLPSAGLLKYISNSTYFTKINNGITSAEGTILGNVYSAPDSDYENLWSSSQNGGQAFQFWIYTNPIYQSYVGPYNKDFNADFCSVRPVLAF